MRNYKHDLTRGVITHPWHNVSQQTLKLGNMSIYIPLVHFGVITYTLHNPDLSVANLCEHNDARHIHRRHFQKHFGAGKSLSSHSELVVFMLVPNYTNDNKSRICSGYSLTSNLFGSYATEKYSLFATRCTVWTVQEYSMPNVLTWKKMNSIHDCYGTVHVVYNPYFHIII